MSRVAPSVPRHRAASRPAATLSALLTRCGGDAFVSAIGRTGPGPLLTFPLQVFR